MCIWGNAWGRGFEAHLWTEQMEISCEPTVSSAGCFPGTTLGLKYRAGLTCAIYCLTLRALCILRAKQELQSSAQGRGSSIQSLVLRTTKNDLQISEDTRGDHPGEIQQAGAAGERGARGAQGRAAGGFSAGHHGRLCVQCCAGGLVLCWEVPAPPAPCTEGSRGGPGFQKLP